MKSKFTLYAIYWLANEWGEKHFNLGRLPFEIAEGVRIEDVSTFILEEAFELVRERNGSEEVKRLRDTQYALVHRYDATTTFANGALIQEDDHDARSEQLIRNIAGCLRLIRPMRQSSSFMQGDVREDGTFDVKTWQSPADLDVPEAHKLFKLYDRDADNLKTYAPEFLKAMVGDIWKFKIAANFHEL